MRNERLDDFSWDRRRMDWDVVVATAQEKWRNTDPAEGKTFWDRTVKNREFWVSTGVDFAVSVVVGVAAAAVVAGLIAVAPFTVGLTAAIVATAIAGIGIGALIEAVPLPGMDKPLTEWAKTQLNGLLSGE